MVQRGNSLGEKWRVYDEMIEAEVEFMTCPECDGDGWVVDRMEGLSYECPICLGDGCVESEDADD